MVSVATPNIPTVMVWLAFKSLPETLMKGYCISECTLIFLTLYTIFLEYAISPFEKALN